MLHSQLFLKNFFGGKRIKKIQCQFTPGVGNLFQIEGYFFLSFIKSSEGHTIMNTYLGMQKKDEKKESITTVLLSLMIAAFEFELFIRVRVTHLMRWLELLLFGEASNVRWQ